MAELDIVIQKVSTDQILDDFDEPITVTSFDDPVTLQGQANFGFPKGSTGKFNRVARTSTGNEGMSFGHLVFRKSYLEEVGVTLSIGDIVVSIAGNAMNLEIIEVRQESPLNGQFLLTYALLDERHEQRKSN